MLLTLTQAYIIQGTCTCHLLAHLNRLSWLWSTREELLLLLMGGGGCHRWVMLSGRWWRIENVDTPTAWTDLVTDPSPAKTGTGTSQVIFFSTVLIP
jgi:hypothetical protein